MPIKIQRINVLKTTFKIKFIHSIILVFIETRKFDEMKLENLSNFLWRFRIWKSIVFYFFFDFCNFFIHIFNFYFKFCFHFQIQYSMSITIFLLTRISRPQLTYGIILTVDQIGRNDRTIFQTLQPQYYLQLILESTRDSKSWFRNSDLLLVLFEHTISRFKSIYVYIYTTHSGIIFILFSFPLSFPLPFQFPLPLQYPLSFSIIF